jgi:surface antigen
MHRIPIPPRRRRTVLTSAPMLLGLAITVIVMLLPGYRTDPTGGRAPRPAADTVVDGTGRSLYGGQVVIKTIQQADGTYALPSAAKPDQFNSVCDLMNRDVQTGSGANVTAIPGVRCDPFPAQPTNVWGDGTNGVRQSAAVDVLYAMQQTHDYFAALGGPLGYGGGVYSRSNPNIGIQGRVHGGTNLTNAFYFANANETSLTFGDGPGNGRPQVALDTVAHEMTHAYTDTLVGTMLTTGQPGSLDEATSDIFAEMVKFYANNPNEPATYTGGSTDSPTGTVTRYFAKPSRNGTGADCFPSGTFSYESHDGAGIGDHFFFDLAEGLGSTAYGTSSPCQTAVPAYQPIGRAKAAAIWFKAMLNAGDATATYRFSWNMNFQDARAATVYAAGQLYHVCSPEYQAAQAAWTAVDVPARDKTEASCGSSYPVSGTDTDPVLFIHGFTGLSTYGSPSTVDGGCPGTWSAAQSVFGLTGWTGPLATVGYYLGDHTGGNSCDVQFDRAAANSNHQTQCDSYYFDPTVEGTNNQDLRNLSCQLAWYVYNTYSVNQRNTYVVAHSMGGLLIRDALDQVQNHNPSYPPYLYVPGVVTFGTPNGGIPSPGGAGVICGGCVQASNMQTRAGDPSAFIDHLTSEPYAPFGSPGEPTAWTVVSSTGESWFGVASDSTFNFPGAYPGFPAVTKLQYTETPGAVPDPYDHGGYLDDTSAALDASALSCANCSGIPSTVDSPQYHSLVLASLALSQPVPAVPAYPVVNHAGGGAFFDTWAVDGGVYGAIGDPHTMFAPVAGGQEQGFAGGALYWSPAYGNRTVLGDIETDYQALGGPGGVLGFPDSDDQAAPGGGHESLFGGTNCGPATGAAILQSASTPASEMQGCIYHAYLTTYGGPAGALGYPTTNETTISTGKMNHLSGTACGSQSGSGLYWNGAVHEVTGCIYQKYRSLGEATSDLGFPVSDPYAYNGGTRQDFQGGSLYDNGGTVTETEGWVVGHAAHAGNDYPYETIGQFEHQNEGTDAWNEYYGQCDSFAAWKVYENLAGSATQHPGIVPAPGWQPGNASVSPVNQFTWGNADSWATRFAALGYTVDTVPTPGAIAYWPNATTDSQDGNPPDSVHGIGGFGHVGYVTDVYPDGSITIEQYNMRVNGEYSVVHLAHGQGYADNSFGQGTFNVPAPKYFIHVNDGPSGAASPTEPANGVVKATYPSQVKVIGPGSSSAEFSTADVWYTQAGHGEIGKELWTHTNGASAVSVATWTPSGLSASTCYRVDAFVPDNYSNNPVAIYTVTDSTGTQTAAVNENVQTNDWSELGVFKTNSSGGITVKVDDRGTTGLYVAADAMRFWKQADCSAQGNASPVMMPSSYFGSWTTLSGHGFTGAMRYSATTGNGTPTKNAMWTPSHLLSYGCYDISLYVPDNFSDHPAASYWSNDSYYGAYYEQVNENNYTNQFAGIGTFQAYGDGTLPLELFNSGPSGDYVAADAAAFVLNPHCMAENGGINAFGSVPTSTNIGPGSTPSTFSTSGNWRYQLGHGYGNHELYTTDGSGATAKWTYNGTPNTCYTVEAYIPNNYANNQTVTYGLGSSLVTGFPVVDQAGTTGWTRLGTILTGSNGVVTVTISAAGTSGAYTAADEMTFIGSC